MNDCENKTHASTAVFTGAICPFFWILVSIGAGVLLFEILYFHVFDLKGFLTDMFSLEDTVKNQGWWNDERKGLWFLGALWGVAISSIIVLRRRGISF